jgi:tetratricopeptide (TPR) repeat protein
MSQDFQAFMRGLTLFQRDRPAEAEPFFREALSSDPSDPETLYFLSASLHGQRGREKEALPVIDAAIAIEPEDVYALILRARILDDLGRDKEGVEAVDRALALSPENSLAMAVRASLLIDLKRKTEAETWARRALEIDPDNNLAQLILASSLRLQGKREEDLSQARLILAQDPDSPVAHANAGYAAVSAADFPQAEKHFLEALRLNADYDDARDGLKIAYRARSKVYAACVWLHHRIASNSSFANTVLLVFYVLMLTRADDLARYLGGPVAARAVSLACLTLIALYQVHVHLGNLALMSDRNARLSLKDQERWITLIVLSLLATGLSLGVIAVSTPMPLRPMAIQLVCAAMLISLISPNESPEGRRLFTIGSILLLAAWLVLALGLGWLRGLVPAPLVVVLLSKGVLGFLLFFVWSFFDRFKR